MKNKVTTFFVRSACMVLILLLVSAWLFRPKVYVNAQQSTPVQQAYENTEVLEDLQGSTIGGQPFSISDWPHDITANPQIISFTEFCYSYWADKQSDYALYLYVYNPRDDVFEEEGNSVQLSFGKDNLYGKYPLRIVSYSMAAGYEGRFYKFKVELTESQIQQALATLEQNNRIYYVSGIELSVGGKITEYPCLQIYTYSGYAKGYGSEHAEGDTLTCIQDGFDKYLTLDVHSTYYRPEGSNGKTDYTHDSLNSVYFAVPKEIVEEYGVMTRIRGEYLKALTSDIFVTGDEDYYSEFYQVIGQDIGYLEPNSGDFESLIMGASVKHLFGMESSWVYNLPYEVLQGENDYKYVSRLNYVLKALNGDADTFAVSSSQLKEYMLWYTANYLAQGESLVAGRYAQSLFEWVDDGITTFDISSEDITKTLTSTVISQDWWDKIWGTQTVSPSTYYQGKSAIYAVQDKDFVRYNGTSAVNISATCDNLYISESDFDEFYNFYEQNKQQNVIYIVRFAVDDFVSAEATQAHFKGLLNTGSGANPDYTFIYTDENTNCYFAQEYVYLNFDIIDLTFTKNDVSTVIPVVMSPIDIVPDITPDPQAKPDDGASCVNSLQTALAVILLLVLLAISIPILPYIVHFLVIVVMLPFKAVGAIISWIKRAKERHKEGDKAEAKQPQRDSKNTD